MRRWHLVCATVLSAGIAGAAMGQEDREPKDAPLAGPKVRERRVPGVEQGFTDARREGRGRVGQAVPHRVFMQVVDGLRGEGEHAAPEEIRLTPEQSEQVADFDREFREAMRAHVEKTRGENDEPRRKARRDRVRGDAPAPADKPAGEGEAMGDPPPPDRDAVRARVEEARRNAPKAADCHTKIYSVLTEPQQDYVKGRLDAWRKEMEERFGEEYMQRRVRQRAGEPGAPPPPDGAPAQGGPRERFRRVAEKLAQLPPEERDRLLARLEEEVERRLVQRGEGAERDAATPGRPPRPDR